MILLLPFFKQALTFQLGTSRTLFAFVRFFTNAGCPAEALLATVAAHQSRQWSIFVVSTKGVSGLAGLYPKKRTLKEKPSCCRIKLRQEVSLCPENM
jgi:hypothetical protein